MKRDNEYRKMSMFTKIAMVTVTIILLISILSTTILLSQFSSSIRSKDQFLVQETSDKIVASFQDKYNTMYNQRTLIHSTDFIADVILRTRENPPDIYKADNLNKITNYLTALCYSDHSIKDAILFTADGKNAFTYSSETSRKVYASYEFNSLPYIMDFSKTDAPINAICDTDPPYVSVNAPNSSKNVITFITKVYDMHYPTKQVLLGYLMINYSPESIDAICKQTGTSLAGDYYVVNNQQQIIYSNQTSLINRNYTNLLPEQNSLVSNQTLSLSGIRIISTVSEAALRESTKQILLKSLLITGVGLLIMILSITALHKHYAKKFARLADTLQDISGGNFNVVLPVTTQDEIGFMSQAINTMSCTLDEYIKKTYLAETSCRTAELYALQAQINPHFLANTIESIRMNALVNGDTESSEMLSKLGSLFRWITQFNEDIIYLEDEIEYTETYLDLQRFRFVDKLSIQMDIPNETYYLGVPKFILQPIVENTITHGLSSNGATLTISIQFRIISDTLTITVMDNGQGMKEADLEHLIRHINDIETYPGFGVALRNVNTRIQLLFGKKYGLSMQSKLHFGTTITVTMPAKQKEELEKYV